jgi:hypothetical protein
LPIKFEEQFKVRDERDVNPRLAPPDAKSREPLRHNDKPAIVRFGLPCGFAR